MKRVIKYFAVSGVLLFLSGCANSLYTLVPESSTVQTKHANSSYIIFSRPEFVGAALSNTIIEFNPDTYDTKYVGTLGPQTKLIYKTTPGTHYFYMGGGENDDMIKIKTGKSKEYYVHTAVGMGIMVGRFYFVPLRYPSLALADSLNGNVCSENILKKYEFKRVKDEVSELTGELKYASTKYSIDIECKKNMIIDATYNGESLTNINDAELIGPNKKGKEYYNQNVAGYVKEIREDLSEWIKNDMSKTAMNIEDGRNI